jgi:predicted DNA-binding transcriptional regulator AlpA
VANADETLTAEQVAELLGTSINYLYQMRLKNRGPLSRKAHGRLQYRRADVNYWMARRLEASTRGGGL